MLKKLASLFTPSSVSIEEWADHNSRKASADDLIAGAIVESFAAHFKHWKFEGEFNQRHGTDRSFKPTELSRKMSNKKHVVITFVFKKTDVGDCYSTVYKYKTIGCEVNGIRVSDAAFKRIYTAWNNIVVQVKAAEQAAAQAKAALDENEAKWNLAEGLLGMKRDGLGALRPVQSAEGEAA